MNITELPEELIAKILRYSDYSRKDAVLVCRAFERASKQYIGLWDGRERSEAAITLSREQEEAARFVYSCWDRNVPAAVRAPTGWGKTVLLLRLALDARKRGLRSVILTCAPMHEWMTEKLTAMSAEPVEIAYFGYLRGKASWDIAIGHGRKSEWNRVSPEDIRSVGVWLLDEAHKGWSAPSLYCAVEEHSPNRKMVYFSAENAAAGVPAIETIAFSNACVGSFLPSVELAYLLPRVRGRELGDKRHIPLLTSLLRKVSGNTIILARDKDISYQEVLAMPDWYSGPHRQAADFAKIPEHAGAVLVIKPGNSSVGVNYSNVRNMVILSNDVSERQIEQFIGRAVRVSNKAKKISVFAVPETVSKVYLAAVCAPKTFKDRCKKYKPKSSQQISGCHALCLNRRFHSVNWLTEIKLAYALIAPRPAKAHRKAYSDFLDAELSESPVYQKLRNQIQQSINRGYHLGSHLEALCAMEDRRKARERSEITERSRERSRSPTRNTTSHSVPGPNRIPPSAQNTLPSPQAPIRRMSAWAFLPGVGNH